MKEKQRIAIQRWKPWTASTGPKTPEGKSKVALNSLKHGRRSAPIKHVDHLLEELEEMSRQLGFEIEDF
jgi:hypothetical protein